MKSKITHCAKQVKAFACLLLLSLLSTSAFAALHKVIEPARGQSEGIIDTLKNYFYDGIVSVSILIGVVPVLVVAWHITSGFLQVRRGKKTLSDFRTTWVIGLVLCMACFCLSLYLFYLATKML